jgi:alpha-ketoglutarate-dependent taurine dioxygenase
MAHVAIAPLHPSLAAEVSRVDLRAPIDDAARVALGGQWHIDHPNRERPPAATPGLLDRMVRPEIGCHRTWRKGDVLVIDTRATMHRAHGDYPRSQSRALWRITVEGDRPRFG